MGYAVGRFSEDVNENLLCSICSCVLEEAVLTPCGHSFCHNCLTTWIEARAAGRFNTIYFSLSHFLSRLARVMLFTTTMVSGYRSTFPCSRTP